MGVDASAEGRGESGVGEVTASFPCGADQRMHVGRNDRDGEGQLRAEEERLQSEIAQHSETIQQSDLQLNELPLEALASFFPTMFNSKLITQNSQLFTPAAPRRC